MGTCEEAGRPGALGWVRAAGQAALGGLWLAVRALADRAGLTLALTALTVPALALPLFGLEVEPPDGTLP